MLQRNVIASVFKLGFATVEKSDKAAVTMTSGHWILDK